MHETSLSQNDTTYLVAILFVSGRKVVLHGFQFFFIFISILLYWMLCSCCAYILRRLCGVYSCNWCEIESNVGGQKRLELNYLTLEMWCFGFLCLAIVFSAAFLLVANLRGDPFYVIFAYCLFGTHSTINNFFSLPNLMKTDTAMLFFLLN